MTLPRTSQLYFGSLAAAAIAFVVALVASPGAYLIALLILTATSIGYVAQRRLLSQIEEQRRQATAMASLHVETIAALALAIDAKQEADPGRLHRVHLYATALARALGMSESEIQGVEAAALLHDIGKLAVPEYLLRQPGALSPEEIRKIRSHPRTGAEIVASVPFPYPVTPLILAHHERWDGGGYPSGLQGEAIPLGARILAAADAFELLTSEPAMTPEQALERLQLERGKALDPAVVDAFVRAYPALAAAAAAMAPSPLPAAGPAPPPEPPAATNGPARRRSSALDDISRAKQETHALYDLAEAMSHCLDVSSSMEVLSNKLGAIVPLSACALFVRVDEAGTIGCQFATGIDADRIRRLTMRDGQWSTAGTDAGAGSGGNVPPAAPAADRDHELGADTRTVLASALVYPLIFGERFVGMLAVYHVQPRIYSGEHARLLARVCEQAAGAIHHAIVFERTQEDSLRDPLTGLANTRYLFLHLKRELARAERLRSVLSLLVLDLDGFKDINDTCGHQVGDRALRAVANALRNVIRSYDVCVRYGGDEFVVVLSGCGKDEAERKRADLQKAIDSVVFESDPGRRLPLAISAGLAVFPYDGVSREELLTAADRRMYDDKTSRKRPGVTPL